MENNQQGSWEKWFILIVVIIGSFMSALDTSIVNIAMTKMMAVFGSNINTTKWVITAYTLTLGAIVPLTGYVTDVFGSKKIYIFSLVLFTAGSFLCGFSTSLNQMIFFRIIQAIGGGMLMPVGMGMIMQNFPIEQRGTALGFWGIAAMAAPSLGPTLGGYIIQYLDWRLIFYINVPIGIFGVILAMILLPKVAGKKGIPFDLIGFITSTIGIVFLLYVLGEGSDFTWSKIHNPIMLTIGVGSLILFVVNELSIDNPLLDIRLFKIGAFSMSQIVTISLTLALMGGTYILPLFLQGIKGYTAMQTGMIMMPSAMVMGIMMPISGKLFDKYGYHRVVLPGLAILSFASFKLATSINLDVAKNTIIFYSILRSMGMGLAMMPINTIGMNSIPPAMSTRASAMSNTARQIFSAISVTYVTTMVSNNLSVDYADLASKSTIFNQSVSGLLKNMQSMYMSTGLNAQQAYVAATGSLSQLVHRQAYVNGMSQATGTMALITVLTFILACFIKDPFHKKRMEKKQAEKLVLSPQ